MNRTIGADIDLNAVQAGYETEGVKRIRLFRRTYEHWFQYGNEESLT